LGTERNIHPRGTEFAEFEVFLIKNSSLRALRASALKIVADPSFGGSAVSQGTKRPAHPGVQIARAAGLKLFCAFSPSEKRFVFLRRPQITLEAFSMMGEAFTMRGISHGENPSRNLFSKFGSIRFVCKTWIIRKQPRIFPKNQVSSDASRLPLAQRFQRVLIFPLEERLSVVSRQQKKAPILS
jgi:hypothetical protein